MIWRFTATLATSRRWFSSPDDWHAHRRQHAPARRHRHGRVSAGPLDVGAALTPDLATLVAQGESTTLEFKRSTGELREALQTACAFANGDGGRVLVGVRPDGEVVGQQVSEQTYHELAAARERFEPPLLFEVQRIDLAPRRTVLVL